MAQANASLQGYNYSAGRYPSSFSGTPFPSFASGADYIPRDLIAMLHQGERVVRAVDNRPQNSARVHIDHIHITNMVGDIATKRDLDGLVNEIATGIQRATYNL